MSLATRDDLLAATNRQFAVITPPGLGKPVRIRTLTDDEWAKFDNEENVESDAERAARQEDKQRRFVVLIVVDDDGNTLLKETDVIALESVRAGVTAFISKAGMLLGQYRAMPDLAKNSAATPASAPVSD